jgi:hypothetical protein
MFLALAIAYAPRAALSDQDIPPLRSKEKMQTITISLMDIMIAPVPYISPMQINRTFTAIGFAVRGLSDSDALALADYARDVMEVRLGGARRIAADSCHSLYRSDPPRLAANRRFVLRHAERHLFVQCSGA